jgi:hypothetical protein
MGCINIIMSEFGCSISDFLLSLRFIVGRVGERSKAGVSQNANALTLAPLAELTHPNIASLVHPLYRKR